MRASHGFYSSSRRTSWQREKHHLLSKGVSTRSPPSPKSHSILPYREGRLGDEDGMDDEQAARAITTNLMRLQSRLEVFKTQFGHEDNEASTHSLPVGIVKEVEASISSLVKKKGGSSAEVQHATTEVEDSISSLVRKKGGPSDEVPQATTAKEGDELEDEGSAVGEGLSFRSIQDSCELARERRSKFSGLKKQQDVSLKGSSQVSYFVGDETPGSKEAVQSEEPSDGVMVCFDALQVGTNACVPSSYMAMGAILAPITSGLAKKEDEGAAGVWAADHGKVSTRAANAKEEGEVSHAPGAAGQGSLGPCSILTDGGMDVSLNLNATDVDKSHGLDTCNLEHVEGSRVLVSALNMHESGFSQLETDNHSQVYTQDQATLSAHDRHKACPTDIKQPTIGDSNHMHMATRNYLNSGVQNLIQGHVELVESINDRRNEADSDPIISSSVSGRTIMCAPTSDFLMHDDSVESYSTQELKFCLSHNASGGSTYPDCHLVHNHVQLVAKGQSGAQDIVAGPLVGSPCHGSLPNEDHPDTNAAGPTGVGSCPVFIANLVNIPAKIGEGKSFYGATAIGSAQIVSRPSLAAGMSIPGVGPPIDDGVASLSSYQSSKEGSTTKKKFIELFDNPTITKTEYHTPTEEVNGSVMHKMQVESEADIDTIKAFVLDFVAHGPRDEKLILKLPTDLATEGRKEWATTLVGHFVGRKLPFSVVYNYTNRLWASSGLVDTLATDSGLFFFSFSNVENRDNVMEGGPWYIAGQPIILRPWTPNISLEKPAVHTIPLWVNLYGIPLEYWNPKGLSFIASYLGKPLRVDRMTATRRRISYARICIEVSAEHELIHDFDIEAIDDYGHPILTPIKVDYQWSPIRCHNCSSFGHNCAKELNHGPAQRPMTSKQNIPPPKYNKGVGKWKAVQLRDKDQEKVVANPKVTSGNLGGRASSSKLEPCLVEDSIVTTIDASLSFPDPSEDPRGKRVVIQGVTTENSFHALPSMDEVGAAMDFTVEVLDTDAVCVDDADGYNDEIDGGSFVLVSSSRQRKKDAKIKHSGSRPKGRLKP